MPGSLFIRLPATANAAVEWLLHDAPAGPAAPVSGDLEGAEAAALGRRVVVLVPTADLLLTEVELPTRNRQRLVKAIPYAIENQLAAEVETLHFAIGPIGAGAVPIAVVARERMQQWLDRLAAAGIKPALMVPDAQALTLAEQGWTLLAEADATLFRTGTWSGASLDTDNLRLYLEQSLGEAGTARPARVRLIDATPERRFLAQPPTDADSEIEVVDASLAPLRLLADGFDERTAINLLQEGYRPRDLRLERLRPWLPAAAIGLVLLLLGFGTLIAERQALRAEEAALSAEIEHLFKAAFPDATRFHQPRVRMEQRLRELRGASADGGGGFIGLLGRSAGAMREAPGLRLVNASFRNGQLELRLNIRDLEALEGLKRALEAQQLRVEIRSAQVEGPGVVSHLRVQQAES